MKMKKCLEILTNLARVLLTLCVVFDAIRGQFQSASLYALMLIGLELQEIREAIKQEGWASK
jgi:hypothetical protein